MKAINRLVIVMIMFMTSCSRDDQFIPETDRPTIQKIIFLHHSTGQSIWNGGIARKDVLSRIYRKIIRKLGMEDKRKSYIQKLIKKHNRQYYKNYQIEDLRFPKASPYGWKNYPFDYYNIWVRNAGENAYMEEPTLEILTRDNDVIIFKHCFPVCNIQADSDSSDMIPDTKSLNNYKLQYLALRDKLHQFPDTKFIVWTGAAQVKSQVTEEEALRAREFFNWVIGDWDIPADNIYIWDFYQLQTEGGLYFLNKYSRSSEDSHPNNDFSRAAGLLFFNRLIDIVENNGLKTDNTGKTFK